MGSRPARPAGASADEEVRTAQRYFSSFADDYHRAFDGAGHRPLHALINRLFRRRTFQVRTALVEQVLKTHGVAGKRVLDLGCGSGEVSIVAARLGATVTGLDVVGEMVAIAQQLARDAGVSTRTHFRVHDIVGGTIDPTDVSMLVGVIEYYRDLEPLLAKVCDATRERVIIVDTRGPWWRRQLRFALARMKRFNLYYHPPDDVAAIVTRRGFVEDRRVAGHSFTLMTFRRQERSA
jgi:SAM-dependent methyltransferase